MAIMGLPELLLLGFTAVTIFMAVLFLRSRATHDRSLTDERSTGEKEEAPEEA